MKYPNWSRVDDFNDSREKTWDYDKDDIQVILSEALSGDVDWVVSIYDQSDLEINNDEVIGFDNKKAAEQSALAILDAINAVYQLKTYPKIDDEGLGNRRSTKDNIISHVYVDIQEVHDLSNFTERDIIEGDWNPVLIIGYEIDERPAEEFQNAFFDYHLKHHRVEPETSFRYRIIDGDSHNKKSYYEKPLKRSSLVSIDDVEASMCEECGEDLGTNMGCETCGEVIREMEEAIENSDGF